MAYSDLDAAKRLLRVLSVSGNNQYKIRFSNSYTLPEAYSSNDGDGILIGLTSLRSDYAGAENWWLKFTSATNFTLYRGDSEAVVDGSGNTSASFTSTSGILSIAADRWSGSPQIGDRFKFTTDSNISDDDGDAFIEDADTILDGMMLEFMDSDIVPIRSGIPTLVQKASAYISASIIFTSVFSNLNTDQVPTLVRRWYNLGRQMVNLYIESVPGKRLREYVRYGRFVSREPLIETIGITEAAGVEGLKGEIDVLNESYDTDYNEEELLGIT